jgi:hypothetical protein
MDVCRYGDRGSRRDKDQRRERPGWRVELIGGLVGPACVRGEVCGRRTQVWGPSKYEFEGPHGRTECVTSPSSQTARQIPPASSPANAVSRLTERILGFRPIPPSLAGGRERCLHAPNQPAQPLTHNENQKPSPSGLSSTEHPHSSTEIRDFSTATTPSLWRSRSWREGISLRWSDERRLNREPGRRLKATRSVESWLWVRRGP